jgi:hypothetical protein
MHIFYTQIKKVYNEVIKWTGTEYGSQYVGRGQRRHAEIYFDRVGSFQKIQDGF